MVWIGIACGISPPWTGTWTGGIPPAQAGRQGFVVTWINPQALIDGTMLFGDFGPATRAQWPPSSCWAPPPSCLWFLGITILISFFSAKFND